MNNTNNNIQKQENDLKEYINKKLEKIEGNTFQDKLYTLSKCNCCPRHSINKPFMFSPWIENYDYEKTNIFEKNCLCSCRHYARFICRQHPEYVNINMSKDSELYCNREKQISEKFKQRDAEFIEKYKTKYD